MPVVEADAWAVPKYTIRGVTASCAEIVLVEFAMSGSSRHDVMLVAVLVYLGCRLQHNVVVSPCQWYHNAAGAGCGCNSGVRPCVMTSMSRLVLSHETSPIIYPSLLAGSALAVHPWVEAALWWLVMKLCPVLSVASHQQQS
jgi:hypothetical protein